MENKRKQGKKEQRREGQRKRSWPSKCVEHPNQTLSNINLENSFTGTVQMVKHTT
jgi:hypothetical protein